MHKRGEPCGSAPRVSAGRSLEQDFKLPAELFNCPACQQGFYYCPEHSFHLLAVPGSELLKLASVRALSLVACIVRWK